MRKVVLGVLALVACSCGESQRTSSGSLALNPQGPPASGAAAAGTSPAGASPESGGGAGAAAIPVAASSGRGALTPPAPVWDWTGVVGTGQSLSVGEQAALINAGTQPFQNLKLSLGGLTVPPFDPLSAELSLVPLVEMIRPRASTYPSAYPQNIYGETPHTAMASQISSLVRDRGRGATGGGPDYVGVHSVVGENGQPMSMLRKGATETVMGATSTGRAFAATLFETQAITRLATAASKSYGMGAVILTHGESDAGSSSYGAELLQLWTDYNQDIATITGQTWRFPLLVSQQSSVPFTAGAVSGASASTLAVWRAGLEHPGDILCTGPKYQYPYAADGVHLVTQGYELLGEKYGEIYYERVVLGRDWRPLEPLAASLGAGAEANVVRVRFHVPNPPLVWDTALPAPHQTALTEWANGRGFEVTAGGTRIPIEEVSLDGDTVVIRCGASVPAGATLGYAATADGTTFDGGTSRWGLLRDSDALVGAVTGLPQPNYAVTFERPIDPPQ